MKDSVQQKPETKLMSELFGVCYRDEDLYESRDGVSLRDTILRLLRESEETAKERNPAFIARHLRILTLKYGLDDRGARSLTEISKEFYVTRARIGQVLRVALRRLRYWRRAEVLKAFVKKVP